MLRSPRTGAWGATKTRTIRVRICSRSRQYLGCPSTSATVERLFSAVGLAYAEKRQKGEADTLSDLTFTKMNVD